MPPRGPVAARLAEASDWLQEYAAAAGVVLTSGTITAALAYRCAVRATFTAAQLQQQRLVWHAQTLQELDKFLASLGWISGPPTLTIPDAK